MQRKNSRQENRSVDVLAHWGRLKLAEIDGQDWLDEDDPLSETDRVLLESRILAHEQNPQSAIPWEKFDAELKQRIQI